MLSPTNKYYSKRRFHPYALGILLLWLVLLVWVLSNAQNIIDWFRLYGYTPPSQVASLATEDTMTAYAKHIFYLNKPNIEGKATFFNDCPNNGGEKTIVLGCYHNHEFGISLLSVTDTRLSGVEQVTAAHEMLHGAYERLSASEKQKINTMLMDYFDHDLHDPRILADMAEYKVTEPNDVVDEMHSVFGTEIVNLPSALEQYYTRYFTDRHQITAYAAQYQSQFTSFQSQVAADDASLKTMSAQISSLKADLTTRLTQLNSDQATLTQEKNSGNITAYNAGVPGYNDKVNTYNAEADQLRSLIDQYNGLVSQRNAIAYEENQLATELSQPVPNK
jgi:hypothetical protein